MSLWIFVFLNFTIYHLLWLFSTWIFQLGCTSVFCVRIFLLLIQNHIIVYTCFIVYCCTLYDPDNYSVAFIISCSQLIPAMVIGTYIVLYTVTFFFYIMFNKLSLCGLFASVFNLRVIVLVLSNNSYIPLKMRNI